MQQKTSIAHQLRQAKHTQLIASMRSTIKNSFNFRRERDGQGDNLIKRYWAAFNVSFSMASKIHTSAHRRRREPKSPWVAFDIHNNIVSPFIWLTTARCRLSRRILLYCKRRFHMNPQEMKNRTGIRGIIYFTFNMNLNAIGPVMNFSRQAIFST